MVDLVSRQFRSIITAENNGGKNFSRFDSSIGLSLSVKGSITAGKFSIKTKRNQNGAPHMMLLSWDVSLSKVHHNHKY